MVHRRYFVLIFVYLTTSEAAFTDILHQCSVKDQNCLSDQLQNILRNISKVGIKEPIIPPFEPFELKHIHVPLDPVNITVLEGTVSGLKDIAVTKFEIQLDKEMTGLQFNSDMDIKGKYKVEGSGSLLQSLFGSDTVHGEGNFNLKLSNVQITLILSYHLEKNSNGDIFFTSQREKFSYEYKVGNGHLTADNIFLGKNDASKVIVDYLNQNCDYLMKTYGKFLLDVPANILLHTISNLSDNIASQYYIKEDLTPFVMN